MALKPITIRAPGFGGLDLEGEDVAGDSSFMKIAKNLVFDNAGRLASRQGYSNVNDLDGTDNVESIFVYNSTSGATVISALADHIFETATDKQGALTHTAANWQFQNFNDKVVGCQQGQTAIVYNGAGNFAAIAPKGGGTVNANGNCLHSAFGRLWTTDNNRTVLYWCGLLDETEWISATTPGDSGELNMLSSESAVRSGYDEIVAIDHLQDKLVVFFENSIVMLENPEDPANMTIFKTINNIGCTARDSVQAVGNDLVFLSRDGLRSLMRATQEDNFPLRDISKKVRGDLIASVSGSPASVKSAYYPEDGIYILLFTGSVAWVFDFKRVFEDGLPRVTTWHVPKWHSIYYHEGTLYIGQEGEYGRYSGYSEDGGSYQIEYKSLNQDFDSPNIKIIKQSIAVFEGADDQQVTFTYEWDYGEDMRTTTASIPSKSTGGVYGTAVYGAGLYGSGISRAKVIVNPGGDGEVLAAGFQANVSGSKLVLEQISHFATLGRIKR